MKKKSHLPSLHTSDDGGSHGKKTRTKPVFALMPEQVIQRCQDSCHSPICAGQVLAVMELMRLAGWPIRALAQRAQISESHLSEFLRVKKFFTTDLISRVAGAFGLKLWELDQLAEQKLKEINSL